MNERHSKEIEIVSKNTRKRKKKSSKPNGNQVGAQDARPNARKTTET